MVSKVPQIKQDNDNFGDNFGENTGALESRPELSNIEAEQAVLGTVILNNEYLNRVSEFLREEHFYEPAHQNIYNQITSLMNLS